jgi:hypothetical protein
MNKNALIAFVRRRLLGREAKGDDQKDFHFQRVAQAINYAYSTLLSQIPLDDKGKQKVESYHVKHYYDQPVRESGGYRYFGVSDGIVSIGEGKGIWYVQPSKGQTQAGRPLSKMNRPAIAAYSNIPIGDAIRDTVWRFGNIANNRQIILENFKDSPLGDIRKVDFGVVRDFASYADTEEVIVPDSRYDLLLDFCVAWLKENPKESINDNN